MAVTEFQRHQIFQWLEAQMGSEKAAIMMDLLPPVGWGDIATRGDLDVLRAEIKAGNADLLLKLYFGIAASQATLVGMVLAAVRFG